MEYMKKLRQKAPLDSKKAPQHQPSSLRERIEYALDEVHEQLPEAKSALEFLKKVQAKAPDDLKAKIDKCLKAEY